VEHKERVVQEEIREAQEARKDLMVSIEVRERERE